MLLIYFFSIAVLLAIGLFFIHNKFVHRIGILLFSLLHIGLSVIAYQNLDSIDSFYFKMDSLAVLLSGLLSLITIPVFYHSWYYLKRHVPERRLKGRFLSLMILLETAITGIYFTDNIILVWVGLEITSILVTFLVYHERYPTALEAAWKYLFISSFGITLAFIGVLFLTVHSGNVGNDGLSFSQIASIANDIPPFFLKGAFLLLVAGYSVKMNIFPLYAATVDAKTTAPFPVNALTSTVLINAGFVAIYRTYSIIGHTEYLPWAQNVLMIIGVISLIIVSLQIFRVKRFKRMYAFSSMEHMALVTIALSLGKLGFYAALLHLILHTLAKTGMFLHFGQIRAYFQSGWFKDSGQFMTGSGVSALVYIFGILTITAIPPSGMFMSEFLIFKALYQSGDYFILGLVLFLLTIIIYVIFKYSMKLLYGPRPYYFKEEHVLVNRFEPISQVVLFSLAIYVAYFTPQFLTDLINASILF
tara:strand:- start:3890 stop:5311 length:1422 start_codon:yes stop_codon:yes gene_type:complete